MLCSFSEDKGQCCKFFFFFNRKVKIQQKYPVNCFSCESSSHASDKIKIHTGHNLGGQLLQRVQHPAGRLDQRGKTNKSYLSVSQRWQHNTNTNTLCLPPPQCRQLQGCAQGVIGPQSWSCKNVCGAQK